MHPMLSADFHQQKAPFRQSASASASASAAPALGRAIGAVSREPASNASRPTWAAGGAKQSTCVTLHADKLRSLSELLGHLARDCDRNSLVDHDTAAFSGSDHGGRTSWCDGPGPSMADLIERVECAVNDLAAAFKSHREVSGDDDGLITPPVGWPAAGVGLNARIGCPSQLPESRDSPRSRSKTPTPRPTSSSQPISPLSPSPTFIPHSVSPALPETPTRPAPSASDLALERSLASLSIDASAGNNTHIPHPPSSPSLAAATKRKSKSTRTSSQLTPSSAVQTSKRSRPSMTPSSRPRFSLGVFSGADGVSFVRTPVTMASPTRPQRASPSPRTLLVPECTPPRPESLHATDSGRVDARPPASPTRIARNQVSNDQDDDDPIIFVSSTSAPRTASASTAQRTVVILSDSDSSPPPRAPRPATTPALRTPRRPAIRVPSDSDSDSDSDVGPATETPMRRAPPARAPVGTPRNTPRRTGGTIQKKLEILRTRFTTRRDDGGGGATNVRRKAVVVDNDEGRDEGAEEQDESDDENVEEEGEDENEDGWWSGEDDENVYDSSFIDDSGDEEYRTRVSRPKSKNRETPDTPSCTPAPPSTPALSTAAFNRAREALTAQAFADFNQRAFNNQLPSNLTIEWNKRLCTTAGRAWPSRFKPTTSQPVPPERKVANDGWVYDARIELSVKVLDSEEKLRRTLLHELCHVAAWLLDHVAKPPHGPRFWHWAKRATRAFPSLEVTTCHDYEINFKYTYVCTVCGYSFGRHSKSVDVERQTCGVCNGGLLRLEVNGGKSRKGMQGGAASTRKPSAYQVFVKERYGQVKQAGSGGSARSHKEVMQVLSEMWAKEGKGKGAAAGGGGDGSQGDADGLMTSAA